MTEEEKELIMKSAWAKFRIFFVRTWSLTYVRFDFLFLLISIRFLWDGHPDLVLREMYKEKCQESTRRGRNNRSRYDGFRLHGSAVDPGICMSDQFSLCFLYILSIQNSDGLPFEMQFPCMYNSNMSISLVFFHSCHQHKIVLLAGVWSEPCLLQVAHMQRLIDINTAPGQFPDVVMPTLPGTDGQAEPSSASRP